MKANELMIGDWVNLKTDIGNKPCVVKEIRYKRLTFSTSARDLWGNEDSEEWFEPIPLTAEILEKNGFERHKDIPPYYMDYYHTREGFTIFNSRTWHGDILESVHEMQHALRLCGLSDLADNFKV